MGFWESLSTYWYLALLLVAAVIGTLILVRKAAQASARARKERNALQAETFKRTQAKQLFLQAEGSQLAELQAETLVFGAAAVVEAWLQKQPDINGAYQTLPQSAQAVYALYYVLEDLPQGLSKFFKNNGKPLTTTARDAVQTVWGAAAGAVFAQMYTAFDEEDETTSLIKQAVADWDSRFANAIQPQECLAKTAQYVLQHEAELRAPF